MNKCQVTKITSLGVKISVKRTCAIQAEYKVTQLGTGDTLLVCHQCSYNYARRTDLFKVELI